MFLLVVVEVIALCWSFVVFKKPIRKVYQIYSKRKNRDREECSEHQSSDFFLKTSDYVIRIMLNVEGKTMVIIHKSKQEKLYQVFVYTVLYEDT